MSDRISYQFDPTVNVLIKVYIGDVSLDDIFSSWDEAIASNKIPPQTIGFVLDYRRAKNRVPPQDYKTIANYLDQNKDVFGVRRMGFITNNPIDTIIPVLLETLDTSFELKLFSTIEAALEWITSK